MSETPVLSIVMSVRNAASTIEETLRSLLAQREVDFELVLMDNGCTDDTLARVEALRDPRIRVHEGPKTSLAAALNMAYTHARAEYWMRFDGDDLCPAGSIAKRLNWLKAHPEFGAVCGSFETMDAKGGNRVPLPTGDAEQEITAELLGGKPRTHISTFIMRAEAVKASGGSREWFQFLDDADFQFRLAEHCRIMYLPILSLSYRLHDATITHTMGNERRAFYDRMAREFAKQRRETGEDDLMRGNPPEPPPESSPDERAEALSARQQLKGHLISSAWREHAKGHRAAALRLGARALSQAPFEPALWKSVILLAFKPIPPS